MAQVVGVVDYNIGNLQSVINAFEKLEQKIILVSKPEELQKFNKIVLPGVGAFGDAMESLNKSGMREAVCEVAKSGVPLLGICLGMQLLFEKSSEFGTHNGLGLIEGEVVFFDKDRFAHNLKVPHMGWNLLHVEHNSPLFKGMQREFYLYFVHSYHAVCEDRYVIGRTHYGYDFVSAVQKENIYGFQPHPEKSHENGLKILKNFMEL